MEPGARAGALSARVRGRESVHDKYRQAQDPRTGLLLGPGSSSLIGQAIVGSGDAANGMVRAGEGIARTGYLWPSLGVAPRVGAAYDVLASSASCCEEWPASTSIGPTAIPCSTRWATRRWQPD